MSDNTPTARLRRQILKRRDIVLAKHTKKPINIADLPDEYPKTSAMKLMERKYNIKLEKVLFSMSLSDAHAKFHWEVDRSTLSRWRKHIRKHLGIIEYYEEAKSESI